MINFLAGRIGRVAFVLFGVVTATFFLARSFADPVGILLGVDADPAVIARLTEIHGFDRPLPEQYVLFLRDALNGDLGISTWQRRPALEVVLERLPYTLMLAGASVIVAGVGGFTVGMIAGTRPGGLLDRAGSILSSIAVSTPDFFFGILLIIVFSVQLMWLPTGGVGGLQHLIMPVLALSILPGGRLARVTREAVVTEMQKDYVLAARARGLTRGEVRRRHVIKAVLPVGLSVAIYDFLEMFTGRAFAVEALFAWPGMALLAIESVLRQDVILLSAVVVVGGSIIAIVNVGSDLLYHSLDRRFVA